MMEMWRHVPGAPAYEVSDRGRVRSYKRKPGPRILAAPVNSEGRPHVCLDGRSRKVHQLVMEAFVGPRPSGQEVLHRDGDKSNNALTNLRYGTRSENRLDMVAHGTHPMANRTHCPANHAYDDANTILRGGSRHCRECDRARSRAWKAKRKAVAA